MVEAFQKPHQRSCKAAASHRGAVRALLDRMPISATRAGIAVLLVVAMTGFAASSRAARRHPAASLRTQNTHPDAQPGGNGQRTTQKPAADDAGIVSDREREDAIARSQVWREPRRRIARATLTTDVITTATCRFKMEALGGTTPKFRCVLPSGREIRAKYGQGPEIPAEAAATRLLATLGFGADTVTLIERLRCHGCPPEPFRTMKVVEATRTQPILERMVDAQQYREFEWVGIEQKFAARPIETRTTAGWAFFELDRVDAGRGGAPRAHVDALRLMAILLAHWDNKSENQRLVCLTRSWTPGTRCREPFLLLNDVGATFGPTKVDLDAWERAPVWADRATCTVSMKELPHAGATFGSARISEAGRQFLSTLLGQLSDAQLAALFTSARFGAAGGFLSQPRPVSEWVRVFRQRARAITDGSPCPAM
jgi:hypothetical protein